MIEILELQGGASPRGRFDQAAKVLEAGGLIVLPDRRFALSAAETRMLDPSISDDRAKNISLDPATGRVSGTRLDDAGRHVLAGLIGRFAQTADALLAELTPRYAPALQRRRTSFRPGAIADRALSLRKDDRRLHVDAFPANPVQGRRILRVFANVNPEGEPRVWNVGEDPFDAVARRFLGRLVVKEHAATVKEALGLTKGRQSAYDQAMLRLHDAAKLDHGYQADAPRRRLELPADSLWVVYTDSVMHAALSGQHALEQTYLMPVEAMAEEALSPLRILERMTGRALA
ncbi:Kdo hydroxylase family protein [Caulobacter sp. S45]|uniref:Kdo hydroxylase family protein n=1 Tax=Caulobacter sp. S45 TaxID=1641861 RepID=UPI00157753D1|nr:Kdo hydroxylase family protein [Caulobacter sp. S45]